MAKYFALLRDVYKVTKLFPSDEKFAPTDDLRRAGNYVVHNIAEGYGRYELRNKVAFIKSQEVVHTNA